MPATTSINKIPYVLPADKPGTYPTTSKAIADAIETALAKLDPTSTPLGLWAGWNHQPGTCTVQSVGGVHTAAINIQRIPTAEGFTATPNTEYQIATIPSICAQPPADWQALGLITFGAHTIPLVYRANTRAIMLYPQAPAPITAGQWGYGTITWVA